MDCFFLFGEVDWTAIQNSGLAISFTSLVILGLWQLWRRVTLPNMIKQAQIKQRALENELAANQKKAELEIRKEQEQVHAIQAQSELMGDMGSVLKKYQEHLSSMTELLDSNDSTLKKNATKLEAILAVVQEVTNGNWEHYEVYESQKIKRALLIFAKAEKRRGELSDEEFVQIENTLKKE